ncbi:hypothetical protein FKM82_024108, partial [Ascaphus truei]
PGTHHAVRLKSHWNSINTSVGQSVLLPVSYVVTEESKTKHPSFKWEFNRTLILFYSGHNCSLTQEGVPITCFGNVFMSSRFNRTIFYRENASLLLLDLQLNDTGVYTISNRDSQDSILITVTVFESAAAIPDHKSFRHFTLMSSVTLILKVFITAFFICYMKINRIRAMEDSREYVYSRRKKNKLGNRRVKRGAPHL